MQIQRDSGLWYSVEYSTFSVSDEASKYLLTAAGYSGDAGDPDPTAVMLQTSVNPKSPIPLRYLVRTMQLA